MVVAASLGVTEGPGIVVLTGRAGEHASFLAKAISDLQVVVLSAPGTRPASALTSERVSVLAAKPRIPLTDSSVIAVGLDRADLTRWSTESVRVLRTGGRLAVFGSPDSGEPKGAAESSDDTPVMTGASSGRSDAGPLGTQEVEVLTHLGFTVHRPSDGVLIGVLERG